MAQGKTSQKTTSEIDPEGEITDLSNAVHAAALHIFERGEFSGVLHGNGHHMAQEVAEYATNLYRKRLTGKPAL
jgi:hypothetical protein